MRLNLKTVTENQRMCEGCFFEEGVCPETSCQGCIWVDASDSRPEKEPTCS